MHESVLLKETIDGLELKEGEVLVDGTLGRAGHSTEALRREKNIFLIGIDRDQDALDESRKKLADAGAKEGDGVGCFRLFLGNFSDMDKFAKEAGREQVDKIILDLGLSSPQIDVAGRGISFRKDEPLIMTMEKEPKPGAFTAQDIVNGWAEEDIANVIYAYADERYAKRIARGIVEARKEAPIMTTVRLVEVIEASVPFGYRNGPKMGKIHPATRTFQALRIAVNDELGSEKKGLAAAMSILRPGGRLAVISFHSLEDRIAKVAIKEWEAAGQGKQSTKKPIEPSEEEQKRNPRSRSAKLRIFIKQS
ncbi:MAG: 16S rRNA (cytosine(1402)-N(4))-methyltransferase RsmH [bacterium]|nr:16S rRNA (cytosine(1402)-N(4))-methyltransferase RsmH [bacterium]